MAKTYAQIQAQIRKLQQEADALKSKEVAGVVARIQAAIAHYGLTAQDLFGKDTRAAKPQATGKRAKLARTVTPVKTAKPAKPANPPAAAKYQDEVGHRWSGIGKRPNWFKAALASGKTAAELLAQKPATN
jgi:DNA-binding protein H-NS